MADRRQELYARTREFLDAFNRNDLDAVMAFFSEDAVYDELNGRPNEGKAAVRAAFEPQFEGRFGTMEFVEDDTFVDHGHGGRSCYAGAKRLGEEIVVGGRERGLDATCLRIFNVYGPGMDPTLPGEGRVVANFLHAVRAGQALPIYGDGRQVRSFLWIDDFVDAVETLLEHPGPLPAVLNVGREEPVQILELAGALERAVGRDLPRRLHVRPAEGTRWRGPDTSRLRELTGWRAKVSLQEGLTRLLDDPTRPALAGPQEVNPCR